MAKTAQELTNELLGLLSPEEKAALAPVLEKNAKFRERVEQGAQFRDAYLEGDEPDLSGGETPEQKVAREAKEKKDREDREAAARAAAAAAGSGGDFKALTTQLTTLNSTLEEIKKNSISKSDLPKLRGELLETTILNATQVMKVERQHLADFAEELDLTKLNEFINKEAEAGRRFPNVKAAYDSWTNERRIEKRIADGVKEALKQKKSGEGVPAQASPEALSPAQELLKKQRGEGGSNVNDYAARLQKIREAREGVGEGAAA